jgi:hypothetical protein
MKSSISKMVLGSMLCAAAGFANDYPEVALHPGYTISTLRPAGFEPQVTGMDFLPNGDMVVVTWRGQSGPSGKNADGITITASYPGTPKVYRVTNTKGNNPAAIVAKEIATGFKDPQGICVVDGEIYVGDIDRIVKLVDANADGVYEGKVEIGKIPSYQGWFEYSFGPVHKNGKLYMALAGGVQNSGWPEKPLGKDRGTVISIPITGGTYSVVATGFRAPDGIGIGPEGEIFVTDNQGGWRPASPFIHVQQGKFYGYLFSGTVADATTTLPAIWAPYRDANDSPTEPNLMMAGPFKGQFIYGDVGRGGIYRAFLEKVDGQFQGSVVTFSGGLECGIHRIRTGANGEIYIGGIGNGGDSNQGWNGKTFGLQKLTPNATTVLEILATHSRSKGMEMEFTLPVGAPAEVIANYTVQQWKNTPDATYGGGKGPIEARTVKSIQLSPDRKRVFLEIDGLKTNMVVAIITKNIVSQDNKPLWYWKTWYTLNAISPSLPFELPVEIKSTEVGMNLGFGKVERLPGKVKVELSKGIAFQVDLVDFQGKSVLSSSNIMDSYEFNTTALMSGVYFLRAVGNGQTFTQTFCF